jgi:microcystin-dependent protein
MKLRTKIASLFHFIPSKAIVSAQPRHGAGFGPAAWLGGLVLLAGLAPGLHAEKLMVPESVNYQGRLESLNTNLTYMEGLYTIEFRIWDSPASTTTNGLLWGESYNVYVKGGYFNVILGNGGSPFNPPNPLPTFRSLREVFRTAPTYRDHYLGITVKQDEHLAPIAGVECVPRQQMFSAPFAFQSQYAQYSQFASSSTAGAGPFIATEGLQVTGNALTSSDMVFCNKGLTVSGAQANLQNGLAVSGPATLSGGLDVSGQTTLRGTVNLACTTTGGGFTPVGGIIMWSGDTPPPGWALCDGTTKLNGVPVPNLLGRFVLGKSPAHDIKTTGGAETHTITEDEMPSHSHTRTVNTVGYAAMWDNNTSTATAAPDQSHNVKSQQFKTDEKGGNKPSSIMPPYYVLAFIIRVQ